MPLYDESNFEPPAPVAQVSLCTPQGKIVQNVSLLIDTGADITLLPRAAVARLGLNIESRTDSALEYDLIGFDSHRSTTQAVDLDMIFLRRVFRGRYLIIDTDRGILGRDVLASVSLLLNGPGKEWSEQTPAR